MKMITMFGDVSYSILTLREELSSECIRDCSAQGPVDDAVKYWLKEYVIVVKHATLREYLKQYGAWDDAELADHDVNLGRLLWVACCDEKEARHEKDIHHDGNR